MSNARWSRDKILNDLKRYSTRREVKKLNGKLYHAAQRYKLLDEGCAHMKRLWTKKHISQVYADALDCSTRVEFEDRFSGSYDRALKEKIMDDVCSHMPPKRVKKYTRNQLEEIALKYETIEEFRLHDGGAYGVAHKRGFCKEITRHMRKRPTGYNKHKGAYLYFHKHTVNGLPPRVKMGISVTPDSRLQRYNLSLRSATTKEVVSESLTSIYFTKGSDPLKIETILKKVFSKYMNPFSFKHEGHTETYDYCKITEIKKTLKNILDAFSYHGKEIYVTKDYQEFIC